MNKLSPKINLGCRSCSKNDSMTLENTGSFRISTPAHKQTSIFKGKTYTKPSKVKTLF